MTTNGTMDVMIRERLAQRRELATAAEIDAIRAEIARELEAEAALAQRRQELEAAQAQARGSHTRGLAVLWEVGPVVERLAGLVRDLQECRHAVDKGVNFEAYGIRDQLIGRPTLETVLPVDPVMLGRLVKAAQILGKVGDLDFKLAEIRATQMEL
jgi:hypothetical protein